jgi:hypothetical protein
MRYNIYFAGFLLGIFTIIFWPLAFWPVYAPQETITLPETSALPKTSLYILKVDNCPEADTCIMNIVGATSVLEKQVVVEIGSYQVPSAHYFVCRLERWKGIRAAKFLEETLKSAEFIFLLNAHKKRRSPVLSGTLLVDGQDITVLMFDMQIAVPKGIEVDWCEEAGEIFEIKGG